LFLEGIVPDQIKNKMFIVKMDENELIAIWMEIYLFFIKYYGSQFTTLGYCS
jgi:hypothetical protein